MIDLASMKKRLGFSANRLVALRERHELSQEQLAEMIGVTRGAIGHWETGRRTIPTPIAMLLIEIEGNPEKFLQGA